MENDDNPFITTREIGDFKTFVENSRAQETQTTNPDYSTMTTYYAFLNGKIAALISCRWQLEKGNLATIGGHIGYQTSPEFRRQGIMTRLLSFALEQYAKRGINPVLITAREDNIASRRTIEKAGRYFGKYYRFRGWASSSALLDYLGLGEFRLILK